MLAGVIGMWFSVVGVWPLPLYCCQLSVCRRRRLMMYGSRFFGMVVNSWCVAIMCAVLSFYSSGREGRVIT